MERRRPCRTKLRFKILLVLMLIGIPHAYSQTIKVSLSMSNAPVEKFFQEIEQKTNYVFLYKDEVIKGKKNITINAKDKPLAQVLSEALEPIGLSYAIEDNVIIIKSGKEQTRVSQPNSNNISSVTGVVKDSYGETLPGVSVVLKNTNIAVSTDIDGKYHLNIPKGTKNATITFSFVGMSPYEVKYTGQSVIDAVLEDGETLLSDVVVEAGIIQRNKVGFTGSYNTVTQAELKSVGNTNVLQSLKSLDPSFVVLDDAQYGSDPNVMANIQVRGGSTMDIQATRDQTRSTANLPLFVLDGFEATLAEINDIDINRIESMTILKDAGSTAIYGAKGANGVIIVETIKPKAGQIMVDYNGDYTLSFADLSQYNLMNAREKLQFELLAGAWGSLTDLNNNKLDTYYKHLANIERGVDSYWLKEPIRNAFTHNHSVTIQGGDSKGLTFVVGTNYRKYEGVMKESDRESFGANFKLIYRGFNNLNISNNASVSGVNATNGAWTTANSFANFAEASPYYKKRNDDGSIDALLTSSKQVDETEEGLGDKTTYHLYNPLYNAQTDSYTKDRDFYFTNNTQIDWFVNKELRLTGSLSLRRALNDYVQYIDPLHTNYYFQTDYLKKGYGKSSNSNEWSINGRANASYSKNFGKHKIMAGLIGQISETNYRLEGFTATGYPEGSKSLSAGIYTENGSPQAIEQVSREVSGIFTFNYNYDLRYLFDFSLNEEGSTAFGRNKKFQEFWSAGIGWNLDREKFAKDWKWLSMLQLKGSIGINSNPDGSAVTSSVYRYLAGSTTFGQGSYLAKLGNPELDWPQVKKTALTIDAAMFDKRLTFNLGYYHHQTNPMVAGIQQKPSTGAGVFYTNIGTLETTGYELIANYYPIFNREEEIMLGIRLMASHRTSKYDNISDALKVDNEQSESKYSSINSLIKYQDGESHTAIWAVRSAGIDPATGKEIYIRKNGTQTYFFDIADQVKVGDTEPDLFGTIGLNFRYKKLEANFFLRYSIGGDRLNSALYNNVENITEGTIIYNHDKRALYDRWKSPGDVAEFTSIKAKATNTPLSSRFIQRDNYIRGESGKISWDFTYDPWIRRFGLKSLKVGVSMNDLFTISTIKTERSTGYPFARAVSLNLSARF